MSKGGSKQQTTTQALDPQTTAMQGRVYNAASNAAAGYVDPGVNGQTMNALGNFNQTAANGLNGAAGLIGLQGYGQTGAEALSGQNPSLMQQFMNPYNASVMNDVQNRFSDLSQRTSNSIDASATGAGAYGGSRAAVANGVAQGELGMNAQQTLAGLESQGYSNAQGAASTLAGLGSGASGTLANLGLSANGQVANLGDYLRQVQIQGNPYLSNLNILKSGLSGTPYGTTTSQPINRNTGAGILGGITSGAALGGKSTLGRVLGGIGGGILGLF